MCPQTSAGGEPQRLGCGQAPSLEAKSTRELEPLDSLEIAVDTRDKIVVETCILHALKVQGAEKKCGYWLQALVGSC